MRNTVTAKIALAVLQRDGARLMGYVSLGHEGGCWIWTGRRHGSGRRYGGFTFRGRQVYAHRAAYELFVGPIAGGLELDHLCRNGLCVNPDHLEPVTHQENVRRGIGPTALNARKTDCQRHGTPLVQRSWGRICTDCARERNTAYRRRLGIPTAAESTTRMWATRTPEQIAEISRKIWATRRERAAAR